MIGEMVGSYRIVAELGKGGMGVVYRAEHVQLGRPAALKMLLPSLSRQPAIVQRFFNEARAASAIDHPGIVEIYDFGSHTDGSAYIVMALLGGESLEQRLHRMPMPPFEGASIVAQVAGALAAAHAKHIVHRDLKPDNIFLVPNDMMPGGVQVKLLDFGIAKLADEQSAGLKTQTGAMMGTPAYMSPEQCMGKSDIDHRTDLYSVGCILFHVLCGRPPFLSEHGTGMMIAAQIRDAPPAPRSLNPNIPDALEAIVLRLLEKEPSARYQTATELRNALHAAMGTAPASWAPPAGTDQYAATMAPSPSQPNLIPDAYAHTAMPGSIAPQSPTTRGGAAAEVVATAPAGVSTRPPSNKGLWLGVAVVLAIAAGAGAFLATRGSGSSDGGSGNEQAATQPPAGEQAKKPDVPAAPANPTSNDPSKLASDTRKAATTETKTSEGPPPETPCPEGQSRRPDTHGECCWPGQAWSMAKQTCVGVPSCPPGSTARGESCVKQVVQPVKPRPVRPTDPPPVTPPPRPGVRPARFRVANKNYGTGDPVAIRFNRPVSSKPGDRAWVTIVEASRPPSSYGVWTYVTDGATSVTLKAPRKPGRYEVRYHTNYPKQRYNVVQRAAIQIEPGAAPSETPRHLQRFRLGHRSVPARGTVAVRFAAPLQAKPNERFWITIVAQGQADSRYGAYKYVARAATSIQLRAPNSPGAYEVRLHANYPTRSTNVVYRAPLEVR